MGWRTMTPTEHQLAWVWFGLVLASIALVPLWNQAAGLLQPCPFRSLTSIPCPTCGATRGVLALAEGRITDAIVFNPLIAASALLFLAGGIAAPLWAWSTGKVPKISIPIPISIRVGIVLLIATNWAWVVTTH
jgi:hypothetical protein